MIDQIITGIDISQTCVKLETIYILFKYNTIRLMASLTMIK